MYEPIGYYTPDGDAYCPGCYHRANAAGDSGDVVAVFPDSETDSPTHCAVCEDLIPESLTADGVAYVRDALEAGITANAGRPCILGQWWEAYGDMVVDAYKGRMEAYYATVPATDEYSPKV